GSSPGRQGYKMAVGSDGELFGSIGGGVMEVNLVNQSRQLLSEPPAVAGGLTQPISEQIHRKNVPNSSGMICLGRQTVVMTSLRPGDLSSVNTIIADLALGERPWIWITETGLGSAPESSEPQNCPLPYFERIEEIFTYQDKLGPQNYLYVVGGGH